MKIKTFKFLRTSNDFSRTCKACHCEHRISIINYKNRPCKSKKVNSKATPVDEIGYQPTRFSVTNSGLAESNGQSSLPC